jgi:hypothetical protein
MPVREKGEGVPVRRLHVPSHVPGHTQTAAKVRGFSPTAPGCTAEIDSPLEGSGFELSVPLGRATASNLFLSPAKASQPGETGGYHSARPTLLLLLSLQFVLPERSGATPAHICQPDAGGGSHGIV